MYKRVIKRLLDIVISLGVLIVLSPLYLVLILLVRINLGSPVFFHQDRPGRNEKIFRLYKFRSMNDKKDAAGNLLPDEARLTAFGKLLRKSSLDELPEFYNILKGDMSFVGPRPERPEIAERYYKMIPDFRLRLQVKAGLTGYAQVYGKYNTDPYEKLEFDLLYINNMSILTDIRLIFATFGILFSKESTEGIEDGALTAIIEEEI